MNDPVDTSVALLDLLHDAWYSGADAGRFEAKYPDRRNDNTFGQWVLNRIHSGAIKVEIP